MDCFDDSDKGGFIIGIIIILLIFGTLIFFAYNFDRFINIKSEDAVEYIETTVEEISRETIDSDNDNEVIYYLTVYINNKDHKIQITKSEFIKLRIGDKVKIKYSNGKYYLCEIIV